jgi:hypothetical protein
MQCAYKCTVYKVLSRSVVWEGGDNGPDPISLTVGECLPDFLGLSQTALVLARSPAPKFVFLSLRSARWGSV